MDTAVDEDDVLGAIGTYALAGGLLLLLWHCGWRKLPVFVGRLRLRNLRWSTEPWPSWGSPPEELPDDKDWLQHALSVGDGVLVRTAGLDALYFLRVAQLGTQVFVPVAFVGVVLLLPIHLYGDVYPSSSGTETLTRLTVANIEDGSYVLYVHIGFMVGVMAWTLHLLRRHYDCVSVLQALYPKHSERTLRGAVAAHRPQTRLQRILLQGVQPLAAEFDRNAMDARARAAFDVAVDRRGESSPTNVYRRVWALCGAREPCVQDDPADSDRQMTKLVSTNVSASFTPAFGHGADNVPSTPVASVQQRQQQKELPPVQPRRSLSQAPDVSMSPAPATSPPVTPRMPVPGTPVSAAKVDVEASPPDSAPLQEGASVGGSHRPPRAAAAFSPPREGYEATPIPTDLDPIEAHTMLTTVSAGGDMDSDSLRRVFRREAVGYLSTQAMSLRELFDKHDIDQNATLEPAELQRLIQEVLPKVRMTALVVMLDDLIRFGKGRGSASYEDIIAYLEQDAEGDDELLDALPADASLQDVLTGLALTHPTILHRLDTGLEISETVTTHSTMKQKAERCKEVNMKDAPILHEWWEGLDILRDPDGDFEVCPPPVPSVSDVRYMATDGNRTRRVPVNSYVVLVENLPKKRPGDGPGHDTDTVRELLEELYPDTFAAIVPIFNHRETDKLLEQYDDVKNKLEVARRRRMHECREPMHKQGCCGLVGERVVSVLSYETRLESLAEQVLMARRKAAMDGPGPVCFAIFKTQRAAAEAAQCYLTGKSRQHTFKLYAAPGPDNVNWEAIVFPKTRTWSSMARGFVIFAVWFLLVVFPTGFFAASLSTLTHELCSEQTSSREPFAEWYCATENGWARWIVSGLLPSILVILWETFVITFGGVYLLMAERHLIHLSWLDSRFLNIYTLWVFLNLYIGGVGGGSMTSFATAYVEAENNTTFNEMIGEALPKLSNFFLVFMTLRTVYLPLQRLVVPHPDTLWLALRMLLNKWLYKRESYRYLYKTPRDDTSFFSPRSVRTGREHGVLIFGYSAGFIFSPVAPVVTLVIVGFFIVSFIVWRYHVLYTYERSYAGGGGLWHAVVRLVLLCLFVGQGATNCMILAKGFYWTAAGFFTACSVWLVFETYTFERRDPSGNSLADAAHAPAIAGWQVRLVRDSYTHPALRRAARGWHPDTGKLWRGYPPCVKRTI